MSNDGGWPKRAMDVVVAVSALLLTSPLFLVVTIAVATTSRGSILFRQTRVGSGGRHFQILKFRTMRAESDATATTIVVSVDDPRITSVGALLRATGLDELPQLFNVLRGEMSIVGPRPTVPSQVERYTSAERRRLDVKPGITGLAQVSGRNVLSWPERIALDIRYIESRSLRLDILIILRTLPLLLMRRGTYGPGGVNEDFWQQGGRL